MSVVYLATWKMWMLGRVRLTASRKLFFHLFRWQSTVNRTLKDLERIDTPLLNKRNFGKYFVDTQSHLSFSRLRWLASEELD